ncbi:MAG: hypothetical protein AAFX50_16750 [Acidobacteriota bacterium]
MRTAITLARNLRVDPKIVSGGLVPAGTVVKLGAAFAADADGTVTIPAVALERDPLIDLEDPANVASFDRYNAFLTKAHLASVEAEKRGEADAAAAALKPESSALF